jgi:hypothetical protein
VATIAGIETNGPIPHIDIHGGGLQRADPPLKAGLGRNPSSGTV